jgi:hypothetical protein
MTTHKNLYEKDFAAWCFSQAKILKIGQLRDLDVENIIEELESMGKQQRRTFTNLLEKVFMHLLKWMYQPTYRSKSWQNSINHHRKKAEFAIRDNPSLKSSLDQCVLEAYDLARTEAANETGLDIEIFPEAPPFTYEDAMKEGWLP